MKKAFLIIAAAVILLSTPLFSSARAPNPPFPLDGKPVYVLNGGKWQEAWLAGYTWHSDAGFRYTVTYIDRNITEEGVRSDRILTLVQARARGVAAKAHNVSDKGWANQMLNAHNEWRKRYSVPPLKWSAKLATYAQQWADKLSRENRFEHRADSPYGENLAVASGQQFTPERVVDLWGRESKDYDHGSNSCSRGETCGHFTQVVWKGTKEVGCGMARKGSREAWVCNYNPPGNIVGRKPY